MPLLVDQQPDGGCPPLGHPIFLRAPTAQGGEGARVRWPTAALVSADSGRSRRCLPSPPVCPKGPRVHVGLGALGKWPSTSVQPLPRDGFTRRNCAKIMPIVHSCPPVARPCIPAYPVKTLISLAI